MWQHARALIATERFRPPRTRDMARELGSAGGGDANNAEAGAAMGRLIEVAPDQFFLSETVAEMASIAAAIAETDPAGTVTAANSATSSRTEGRLPSRCWSSSIAPVSPCASATSDGYGPTGWGCSGRCLR